MSDSVAKRHESNLLLSVEPVKEYMLDESITDLYINPDGKLFIKRFSKPAQFTEQVLDADTVKRIINFTASMIGQVVNESNPVLEGIMPRFNMRIEAIIPPWVSAPCICIRKKYKKVIQLTDFISEKRLTETQYAFLCECIRQRKNILIAGETGSGKTTFLNSLIDLVTRINPEHRLIIVEDTGEINCSALDFVSICVEPLKTVNAARTTMRLTPKRIIFGELRYGDTALEVYKNWKTHAGGFATMHAESAGLILSRFRDLLRESIKGHITKRMIAEVVHTLVFMADTGINGPVVTDILKINVDTDTKQVLYTNIK